MTSSQPPPLANPGPGTGGDRPAGQGEAQAGPVGPATLAGAVLALLTYLCGFFGAYEFFVPMILVLAGGLLALLGMLPKVGRVLVPAAVLTSSGFFLLLLNATSPGFSTGAVKWVALALALLSAAAVVTALLFEVGVLTAPAPRPARSPQAPPGWSPYGGGYGAPGQQPGPGGQPGQPGQPGLFEQGQTPYGYGYGAPQGYQGYGTPGYQAGAPGTPGQPPVSTGGYGAVGAGGAAAGAAGYGQGYGAPAYGTPGYQGYGAPGYVAGAAAGAPYGTGAPGQPAVASMPGTDGPGSPHGASSDPSGSGAGAPSGYVPGSGGQGAVTSTGPSSTAAAGSATPGSAPGYTPGSTPGYTPGSTPASAPTLAPTGDSGPEATTPGVPANGGDTLADDSLEQDDDRTRSFRPGENPSGPS